MDQVIENYFNKKDVVYCKVSRKGDIYEIPLCVTEVLKSYKYCAFKLAGIPPNRKSHEGFVAYCIIHHVLNVATPDAAPEVFLPEMTLKISESEFDSERKNFGNHLAKYLKLPTRNIPFKNCRIQVDPEKSENFSPVTVFEKPVNLHVLDQHSQYCYNFILDWPSRIAIFNIPQKSISTFITCYF
ncbi:MAG TPA: hypothetical protein VHO70_00380 [Chitinispirillaceae bacterium]|nr:hypothetical protein [Chitinispirillaceae bacterium]